MKYFNPKPFSMSANQGLKKGTDYQHFKSWRF